MRIQIAIAFLLGAIATFLAVLVFSDRSALPTFAQSSGHVGGFIGVTANTQPGARDIIWLIDSKSDTPRLCIYEIQSERLKLVASRNIRYDFLLDEFPPKSQTPSVKDVFEETKKAADKARAGPGGSGGGGSPTPKSEEKKEEKKP